MHTIEVGQVITFTLLGEELTLEVTSFEHQGIRGTLLSGHPRLVGMKNYWIPRYWVKA